MNIAHISHTDAGAGAGRAAYRIHQSLLELGEHSRLFVSSKRTNDPTVMAVNEGTLPKIRAKLCEYLEAKKGCDVARPEAGLFSPARFGHFNPARNKHIATADVIGLYWVNGGFIAPEQLARLKQPIVWRLSDMWPFTGGCHYAAECTRYTNSCGNCPQLVHSNAQDLSQRLWGRKRDAWAQLNLTIAAPSRWMAECAKKSTLFADHRIEVIPTGIDTELFAPRDRIAAREALGIPTDKTVLLFGAMDTADHRKGFAKMREALALLATTPLHEVLLAVTFGGSTAPASLPIASLSLGRLDDDATLANAYSAADVMIVPSLEDNLPNVALEAIACGTPVVGFNVCGMGDIVKNGFNGALAPEATASSLAHTVTHLLERGDSPTLRANARTHALQHFSLAQQAQSYLQLYRELIGQ